MLDVVFGGVATFLFRVAKTAMEAVIRAVLTELNISAVGAGSARRHAQAAQDIDHEISERERSAAKSGRPMSAKDQETVADLNQKKSEEFSKYEEAKKAEAAEQLNRDAGHFGTAELTPGSEHRLQYHLGLVVLQKRCPTCGFPMKLQHQNVPDPTFEHFFWQCTRFYVADPRPKCRSIQFSVRDMNMLYREDTPELEISKQDLTTIASQKPVQADIIERMHDHLGEPDEDIVCPVHLVAMELRQKSGGASGPLLDRYHLGCSHFRCSQTTKLKSYPQLAAYLRRNEEVGILS